MIVIVDANAIVSDFRFRNARWAQLGSAIAEGTTRVIVPAIAVMEAKSKHAPMREVVAREMEKASKHGSLEARALVDKAAALTRSEAEGYADWLDSKLSELGFEIMPTASIDHDALAARAVARTRPFNETGGGYRDALHWASALELMSTAPDDDFVFVSGDGKAYANPDDHLLHVDLANEASAVLTRGRVELVRDIGGVQIPDRYRGEPVEVDFDDQLTRSVHTLLLDGALDVGSISPESLGFLDAEWIDFLGAESFQVLSVEAKELRVERVLEVTFVVTANVDIAVSKLVQNAEGDEVLTTENTIRKISFSGRGLSSDDLVSLSSIENLTVELFRNVPDMTAFLAQYSGEKFTSLPASDSPEAVRSREFVNEFLRTLPPVPRLRAEPVYPKRPISTQVIE